MKSIKYGIRSKKLGIIINKSFYIFKMRIIFFKILFLKKSRIKFNLKNYFIK